MTSTTAVTTIRTEVAHDLYRAERELAAIAERTRLDQRLEGDDVSERILRRVAVDARERLEGARTDVPAAPIILVTTGHPTLHQHPGRDGEDVHPRLGRLLQPRHLSSVELTAAAGIPWAADNDCFQGLDEAAFVKMIDRLAGLPGCLFVTVPDVVGDHDATLESFGTWAPELERRGLPLGFVAQDGATPAGVPWDRIAALFIGGSNDFKLGPAAARLAREAKARGKWVHWGRVNTRKRFDLIVATGAADSFDGSKWARWRKTYLPDGLTWLDEALEMREAALEVERRGLPAAAGGSPEFDVELAELAVLEAFDLERGCRGHDYGGGQRRSEVGRRHRSLEGKVDQGVLLELVQRGLETVTDPLALRLALARVIAPRERRLGREGYRSSTPATRRTAAALAAARGKVEARIAELEPRAHDAELDGPSGLDLDAVAGLALSRSGAGRPIDVRVATPAVTGWPWEVVVDLGPAGRSTQLTRSREEAVALGKAAELEHRACPRLAAIARALAGELRDLAEGTIDGEDRLALERRRIYRDALKAYRTDADLEAAADASRAVDLTN